MARIRQWLATGSVEVTLPVGGHGAGRPGDWLVGRVTIGWGQHGSFEELARSGVEEPVLAGFEALQHLVPRCLVVGGCVLAGRVIATTDVPASDAAAQVQPPPWRRAGQAFRASGTAWRHSAVDLVRDVRHSVRLLRSLVHHRTLGSGYLTVSVPSI